MKKLLLALACASLFAVSCTTDYYEPSFGIDNLPETIPVVGGDFYVDYDFQLCETRADAVFLDWEYRVVICETVVDQLPVSERMLGRNRFVVSIPRNDHRYPRPVIVEASVHYKFAGDSGDWWGDWFPVASSVQLGY